MGVGWLYAEVEDVRNGFCATISEVVMGSGLVGKLMEEELNEWLYR